MKSSQKLIAEFTDEINSARKMILYYENQILRKELAIAELLDHSHRKTEAAASQPISSLPAVPQSSPVPPVEKLTYPKMVDAILPDLNGDVFDVGTIRDRVELKFPVIAGNRKNHHNIYMAVRSRLSTGQIIRVPGGFQNTSKNHE